MGYWGKTVEKMGIVGTKWGHSGNEMGLYWAGWSIWYAEYRYPEELSQTFMSCNLITGIGAKKGENGQKRAKNGDNGVKTQRKCG